MKYTNEICRVCQACEKGNMCMSLIKESREDNPIKLPLSKSYSSGLRFSSDAFDCAIPISIDQHSGCSYNCLYCFSNNLSRALDRGDRKKITGYKQWDISKLKAVLEEDLTPRGRMARAAKKMIRVGSPVQWGGLGDPFDEIERATGWGLEAISLFQKHKIPVRISTKGARVLSTKPYLKVLDGGSRHFWFAFSIITSYDHLIERIDLGAPNATERFKCMKILSDMGFKTSLRWRPFIPFVSDRWKGEPNGWKITLQKAAEAGAKAVSFEWIFLFSVLTPRQKAMYRLMFRELGKPDFGDWYTGMSDVGQACRRANRGYKYDLTMKIREETHRLGMVFSSSDPHFKEYGDTGCCCGILPDDPVFGKWSRGQLTHLAVEGRKGNKRYFYWKDLEAGWMDEVRLVDMVNLAGHHDKDDNRTFGDHLHNKWNNPKHPRGPFRYLGGVLRPCGIDESGDLIYKYEDWEPGSEEPRYIEVKNLKR